MSYEPTKNPQDFSKGGVELQPTQQQVETTYPTYPGSYQYTPVDGTNAAPAERPRGSEEKEEKEEKEKASEDYEAGSIPVEHLNLEFDACFHEHKSTKTWPKLYMLTGLMYKYTKLFVYHFFVLVIGLFLAFIWAIINGIMAFIHVWIWGPALKLSLLWIYAVMPLVTEPLRAMCTPLVDVQARIFRQIRVQANLSGPLAEKLVRETTSL